MGKIPLTSVLVLVICYTLLSALLVTGRSSPEKISFSYGGDKGWKASDLTLQGDANFTSDGDLRLTRADSLRGNDGVPLTVGRVLYATPISFWREKSKACSFKTTVKFFIKQNGDDELWHGDGLVFFITAVNSTVKAPGSSFGVFDESGRNPSLFAVEFDAFVNEKFDPPYPHVGIDIGSQRSSNVTTAVYGIIGELVTADINYDAATNLISVRGISVLGSAVGKAFELSYVYDLSSFLPQQVQVGISAATGEFAAAVHELVSWSFTSHHI